ncbi:MAG: hypothetical protein GC137_09715 [Alphaproteobacteria bacterium]|nr:hypothetical protein [Alphaproteobacteria bacterium]
MLNKFNTPKIVSGITHPLVADMYLKKDFGSKKQDVLIIETKRQSDELDHDSFDSYLIDLLTDLEDLKAQAEKKVGFFDRIDIRTNFKH